MWQLQLGQHWELGWSRDCSFGCDSWLEEAADTTWRTQEPLPQLCFPATTLVSPSSLCCGFFSFCLQAAAGLREMAAEMEAESSAEAFCVKNLQFSEVFKGVSMGLG